MTKQTEIWKRHSQPYCVSRYDEIAMRSRPFGSRRYATVEEALAVATRQQSRFRHLLMVDYYEAIA